MPQPTLFSLRKGMSNPELCFSRAWGALPSSSDLLSRGFDDTARTYTPGANPHPFDPTVNNHPDFLKIWIPHLFGFIMGVADVIAHHGALSTYFTHARHSHPPWQLSLKALPFIRSRRVLQGKFTSMYRHPTLFPRVPVTSRERLSARFNPLRWRQSPPIPARTPRH